MYSRTIMVGRLVEDPELRHTQSGVPVSSFRVAVDRAYKVNGEKKADFFSVIAWRQTGEFVCKYFKKGNPLLIDGHFENRSYDKDGVTHYITEMIAENVSFVGSGGRKPDGSAPLPEPPETGSSTSAPPKDAGAPVDININVVDVPSEDLPF